MTQKPLFVVTSRRVYRPDETPPDIQAKACDFEARHLEPEILTDRMLGSFEDEIAEHGLRLQDSNRGRNRGPFWTLDTQGSGVGIALACDDVAKYATARKIPHDATLLAKILESGNGPELTSKAGGRDGCRTEPAGEYCLDDPAEIKLAQAICDDWAEYVRGLAHRMHKDLETDRDYLTSWEAVRESLISNDCGTDSRGIPVALSDCEEREE